MPSPQQLRRYSTPDKTSRPSNEYLFRTHGTYLSTPRRGRGGGILRQFFSGYGARQRSGLPDGSFWPVPVANVSKISIDYHQRQLDSEACTPYIRTSFECTEGRFMSLLSLC